MQSIGEATSLVMGCHLICIFPQENFLFWFCLGLPSFLRLLMFKYQLIASSLYHQLYIYMEGARPLILKRCCDKVIHLNWKEFRDELTFNADYRIPRIWPTICVQWSHHMTKYQHRMRSWVYYEWRAGSEEEIPFFCLIFFSISPLLAQRHEYQNHVAIS